MPLNKTATVVLIAVLCVSLGLFVLYGGGNEVKNAESDKSLGDSGADAGQAAYALRQTVKRTPVQRVEISFGWTVTSYQDVNEAVYNGVKTQVFDLEGNSLGYYKTDFLEQVKIDGSGKGDSIRNSGQFLHYDYNVDDGETYYLVNRSLGAYENELVPWTGDKPSIAVNPPLPQGTKVRFKDLGPMGGENPGWVIELMKNKTFYADDKFYGVTGKRIDVYVGLQKTKEMDGTPESLWMENVTVEIVRSI